MARLCIVPALVVLSLANVEDEFADTKSCDEMSNVVNLLQKDAILRDRTTHENRAGAAMTAKDLLTLRSDPFQRVWFLCNGSKPQPRTEEMIAAEIEVEDELMCTAEMTFEGLCCAPWSTGLNYSQKVSLGLKAEQEQTSVAPTNATESVIKLCTESTAGEIITNGEPAKMPVQCFEEQYTQADLMGSSTLGAGEAILRARISFFLQQGISVDAIPLCANEVSLCPDGSAPAVVQDDWIQALMAEGVSLAEDALSRTVQLAAETRDAIQLVKTVKDESEAALEEGWIDGSAPASAGQGVLSLGQNLQKRKRRGGRRGGGGALVTTGEFTMSSNRGGNS